MSALLFAVSGPLRQSVLALGGTIADVAGIITVQLWARRRERGEDASTAHGGRAEAMLHGRPRFADLIRL